MFTPKVKSRSILVIGFISIVLFTLVGSLISSDSFVSAPMTPHVHGSGTKTSQAYGKMIYQLYKDKHSRVEPSPTPFPWETILDLTPFPSPEQQRPLRVLGEYDDQIQESLSRNRTVISRESMFQGTNAKSSLSRFKLEDESGLDVEIPQNAFQNFPQLHPQVLNTSIHLSDKNSQGHHVALLDALDKQLIYTKEVYDVMTRIINGHAKLGRLRANACILVICENEELPTMLRAIGSFEFTFNARFQYPYVFLSEKPLDETFRKSVTSAIHSSAAFGTIPQEHWAVPMDISLEKLDHRLHENRNAYLNGGSLWHRQMHRYKSSYFASHPLLQQYRYAWKIEHTDQFECMMTRYDPLLFLAMSRKRFGFISVARESVAANAGLFDLTIGFIKSQGLPLSPFLREAFFDAGKSDLNGNIFETESELLDLEFFRSSLFESYIGEIDRSQGFFFERYSDSIVHTLGVSMLLPPSEIHHFADFSLHHHDHWTCPKSSSPVGSHFERICWCERNDQWSENTYWAENVVRVIGALNNFTVTPTAYL